MSDVRVWLSESEEKAVLPIVADRRMFGTCFHVHREAGKSYVLTALHVLDMVERNGASPTVDGASILSRLANPDKEAADRYENDLALLAIDELPEDIGILPLSDDLANNESIVLVGHQIDLADVRYFRRHSIEGSIKGSVGFLGQSPGVGAHGLGLDLITKESIPGGFSGGPVYDPTSKGVLGVTLSRQSENRGDSIRTLGVAKLLEFADKDLREGWEAIVASILGPVFAIPPKREVAAVDTTHLQRILGFYSIVMFLCAAVSIWITYTDDPVAWQLQFDLLRGTSCTSIAIGWVIEIVFTAIFLLIARSILIWYFSDDCTRFLDSILYPERARERLTIYGVAVLIAGIVLFLTVVTVGWWYHTDSAPQNLDQWARREIELSSSKYLECQKDIKRLEEELNGDALRAYRETYLKYFPYSFVNFVLIAVPLSVVLAIAAARDGNALLSLGKKIKADQYDAQQFKDAREWFYLTRAMRGPFQDYRLHCEQIIRRSLGTFALFSPLAMFSILTSNLSKLAFAFAVLAAVIIFLGPLTGILAAFFSYQGQIDSLRRSITESRTLTSLEKKQRSDEFMQAYSDLMWRTVTGQRITLIGAVSYVLLLIVLLIAWRTQ